jgi:uncharacterized protein (DUF488 family)
VAKTKHKVWTIGYEKRTPGELVEALRDAGIEQLIDVRQLPLSRRKGFSKTPLSKILGDAGIAYVHLRNAGNPFRNFDDDILALYAGHLERSPEVVDEVVEAISTKRSALMCLERDHAECHRSILAAALARRGAAIENW